MAQSPTPTNEGFTAFDAAMANTQDDVTRAVRQLVSKVFKLYWSDKPEGVAIDPIPNPKRYLVFGVSLGPVRFLANIDLGTPGWFTARCHNTGNVPPTV
jgi:hypothetical protein